MSFTFPFYDLMIFVYTPKEWKLTSRKLYKQAKGPQLVEVVLSSALPFVLMPFDEVGTPVSLSGCFLLPLTFQWFILYLWQYSQRLI